MRKTVVKKLKKEFEAMYASAAEEAVTTGQIEFDKEKENPLTAFGRVLPRATAWRIFKRSYLTNHA